MQYSKKDLRSLSLLDMENLIKTIGEPSFRAKQLFDWVHKKRVRTIDEMTNLSKTLRQRLKEEYTLTSLEIKRLQCAHDGTKKLLYSLSDGELIESVLMSYEHGLSICISSQVGCRMGCSFCASGMDGLIRDLTPGEIVDQIYAAGLNTGQRIGHVVLMGMGEPLDNYDNVIAAIRLMTDERGLNISARNITLSTCGLVDKIKALSAEELPITLAISLHASSQNKREALMPVARSYGIKEVVAAGDEYMENTKRRVTYEYCVIPGKNDTDDDIKGLTLLLGSKNIHLNLIGLHGVKEKSTVDADKSKVLRFKNKLEKNGINVTIRRDLGQEIDGACGQLRKREKG